jgi:hypothetical protein
MRNTDTSTRKEDIKGEGRISLSRALFDEHESWAGLTIGIKLSVILPNILLTLTVSTEPVASFFSSSRLARSSRRTDTSGTACRTFVPKMVTRSRRTHLKLPISYLYKQPTRPIDLQKTFLSERGDEGEVGKSGISSDNFSFRALHQVLDVAHHFRQMGVTGKKVISNWSKARSVHCEPKDKNKNQSCRSNAASTPSLCSSTRRCRP